MKEQSIKDYLFSLLTKGQVSHIRQHLLSPKDKSKSVAVSIEVNKLNNKKRVVLNVGTKGKLYA